MNTIVIEGKVKEEPKPYNKQGVGAIMTTFVLDCGHREVCKIVAFKSRAKKAEKLNVGDAVTIKGEVQFHSSNPIEVQAETITTSVERIEQDEKLTPTRVMKAKIDLELHKS